MYVCFRIRYRQADRSNLFRVLICAVVIVFAVLEQAFSFGVFLAEFFLSDRVFAVGFSLGVVGYLPNCFFFNAPCSGCIIVSVTYM